MKNIHLILVNKVAASLYYCSNTRDFFTTRQTPDDLLYEMYITSDEEIKEGDWALQFNDIGTEPKIVFKTDYQVPPECVVKKIILTTDEYLINDDAQAIDNEFLEWFVKNPSCEEVEVKPLLSNNGRALFGYKIIIPKEEPKERLKKILGTKHPKQETLEDAAEGWSNEGTWCCPVSFEEGAKWQQERMYSEEEVLVLLHKRMTHTLGEEYKEETTLEWFEKLKKK